MLPKVSTHPGMKYFLRISLQRRRAPGESYCRQIHEDTEAADGTQQDTETGAGNEGTSSALEIDMTGALEEA